MTVACLLVVATVIVGWLMFVPLAHAGVPCHGVVGTASWYGSESGRTTASGQHFNPDGISAAMPNRSMLGKRVRVTYQGRSIVVLVDDIGPAARTGRVIDLSRGAARSLGITGIGRVCVEMAG